MEVVELWGWSNYKGDRIIEVVELWRWSNWEVLLYTFFLV